MNTSRYALPLILIVVALGSILSAEVGTVHASDLLLYVSSSVAPEGDGTREAPFDSLEDARGEIRRLRQTGRLPGGKIVVEVLPGRYELNDCFALAAEDSGEDTGPIVYRSSVPGKAVLSGAVRLSTWQPVTDPAIEPRLLPDVRTHVLCADLPAQLPDPLPGFANGGSGYRGKPDYPIALFQHGQRLPIARWPNDGYAKMGPCVGRHEKRGHVGTAYTEGVFVFDSDRLRRWSLEPDAWFDGLWFHHWADQKMGLKEIDLKARTIALRNPESHAYGFKAGQQFFAFNMIGEIDRPGEWAVDRERRKVYLWPVDTPNRQPVYVASCDHLITMSAVANVSFEGFVFEGSRETGIVAKNCRDITISGCTLRHLGSWGVDVAGGRDCRIVGCDLYDLGEGGVKADGGVRDTLEPGNHLIENNHIHHFGRIVSTYRPGAAVYGVGNRIRHNLIYEAQHQAIYFRGNDHLIEYNIVHDVCLHSSDAGAIYACTRDWSQRGTIIRHNLIHALGEGLDGTGCRAIYLDDMTSGTIVECNIVTMGDHGLNFGGGQDNRVTDNIAINCKCSVNLASRGVDSFARPNAEKGRNSVQFKLLLRDETLFRNALWSKRYPRLLAPLGMDPIDAQNAHFNTIDRNVNVGGGEVRINNAAKVMRTCTVEDNVDFFDDPGFVDLASLDLRLKKDAPLLAKLPNFQPPDFQQMGLYDDPRRASPAVKFGPHVSPLSPIMTPEARRDAERPKLVTVPPGGAITVDGLIGSSEWSSGALSELTASANAGGQQKRLLPSRVWLCTDEGDLYIALEHAIAEGKRATGGATWGQDDAFEVVLAPARDERLPSRLDGIVLRGYANGNFEVAEGDHLVSKASNSGAEILYAANASKTGQWTAEFRIPLQAIGDMPANTNLPIYCHVTAFRAAVSQWVTWRERWSLDPTDAKCACALWLRQFGAMPFMPGLPVSAIRIDVQGNRDSDRCSMEPGEGAEAPDWAVKWNRLVTTFGTARADRWMPCRFEFMPLEDTNVRLELMGTQSPAGETLAWTYYDDFHVEGADLINGDFEEAERDGRTPGWSYDRDQKRDLESRDQPGVMNLGSDAASGGCVAKASHDFRVSQTIAVKKGKKVVVRFQARGALSTE